MDKYIDRRKALEIFEGILTKLGGFVKVNSTILEKERGGPEIWDRIFPTRMILDRKCFPSLVVLLPAHIMLRAYCRGGI